MNKLMTTKQVADLLNCRASSVYAWAKEGRIPALKLNGILRFDPVEIDLWVKQSRIEQPNPAKKGRKRLGLKKDIDIDALVSNAIESVKGARYNTPQRENQAKSAHKEVE